MNTVQGTHVFHRYPDHPTMILYRRIGQRYMMLVFENKYAQSRICGFSDILDAIPVHTQTFSIPELPLLETLDATQSAWLNVAHRCLMRRSRRSR